MTSTASGIQHTDPSPVDAEDEIIGKIRDYWNEHIHDLEIARHPVGTKGFFDDLHEYRFDKLDYLPKVVDFSAYKGKSILEVGCGVGTDLLRFAQGGADVTGVDLAGVSVDLAQKNFAEHGQSGRFMVMNGEALEFEDDSFDVVYAHGVLQYTSGSQQMLDELRRVLKPGGEAIFMVYNRISWLSGLSKISGSALEHEDAPVFKTFSIAEFKGMLTQFSDVEIIPERFPVKTRLHGGIKGKIYNTVFVGGFNLIPKPLVRRYGWHIMAKATKVSR